MAGKMADTALLQTPMAEALTVESMVKTPGRPESVQG
jgi:hypothetical protein